MQTPKVHSLQAYIDKGLQSQNLVDVLTLITECARYIREFPFPNFVHTTLYRLAQAFNGEIFARKFEHSMNTIRLRIVIAVRECRDSLGLVTSAEEIVRTIMKVSHSNDYKARSLTLLLLAALAPLISEDGKVHNLVIESLDCTEETELSAAIHATNDLSKCSTPFSALIVRKIAEMFGQEHLNVSTKIELIEAISNIKDSAVAENCIQLGNALLLEASDDKMRNAIYCSLTHLADGCERIITPQISLLLVELHKMVEQRNLALVHCILNNLSRLALHHAQWTRKQVETIRDSYTKITAFASKAILCALLHCLQILSATGVHNKCICENLPWINWLGSGAIVPRIFAIKLAFNLVQDADGTDNKLCEMLVASILQTLSDFIEKPTKSFSQILCQLRREFFIVVSRFVRSPMCAADLASAIAQRILSAQLCESNQHFFELLAVVSDTYWHQCKQLVSDTLFERILIASTNLASVPSIVFTLLLSTTPTTLFADNNESGNGVEMESGGTRQQKLSNFTNHLLSPANAINNWTMYLVARAALRYGQWRTVALPLLNRIRQSCETMETESWISSLIRVCHAQPTAFSVDDVSTSEGNFQYAAMSLKVLSSMEKNQPFAFGSDYAGCMEATLRAIRAILTVINVKMLGLPLDGTISPQQRRAIVLSISANKQYMTEAKQQWVALCGKSFDADTQTLLQMGLMIRMCLLFEQYLTCMCEDKKEKKLSEIPIEDLGECTKSEEFHPNAQVLNFHALLNWARTELLATLADNSQSIGMNLHIVRHIFKHLLDYPLGLPRFFFQRVQRTRIKLIITPQPSEERGVFKVTSMDLLPVVIEGIIESDNQKCIESVCVVLTFKRDNMAVTEKKQMIQLEPDQKYFKAQFLLKISHQKTRINAKVWFTDTATKKQWFDETDTVALTVELLDAGAATTTTATAAAVNVVGGGVPHADT